MSRRSDKQPEDSRESSMLGGIVVAILVAVMAVAYFLITAEKAEAEEAQSPTAEVVQLADELDAPVPAEPSEEEASDDEEEAESKAPSFFERKWHDFIRDDAEAMFEADAAEIKAERAALAAEQHEVSELKEALEAQIKANEALDKQIEDRLRVAGREEKRVVSLRDRLSECISRIGTEMNHDQYRD